MDLGENFGKRSYRNRCEIMTANGVVSLTVPVERANSGLPIKEMRIYYGKPWQRVHIGAIRSSYATAPYFEYYFDEIESILSKKFLWLIELNETLLDYILKTLKIEHSINKVELSPSMGGTTTLLNRASSEKASEASNAYAKSASATNETTGVISDASERRSGNEQTNAKQNSDREFNDFRGSIHPNERYRCEDPDFEAKPYRQVFSDKLPFAPNLSILDLLFCVGPDSKLFL